MGVDDTSTAAEDIVVVWIRDVGGGLLVGGHCLGWNIRSTGVDTEMIDEVCTLSRLASASVCVGDGVGVEERGGSVRVPKSNECRFRFLKWMDWIYYLMVTISNSAGRYLCHRRNEGLGSYSHKLPSCCCGCGLVGWWCRFCFLVECMAWVWVGSRENREGEIGTRYWFLRAFVPITHILKGWAMTFVEAGGVSSVGLALLVFLSRM
jgi:hypothetical protein